MQGRYQKPESANLRRKAEELLKKNSSKKSSSPFDANILNLVHELEVHQIELQLQNEELTLAYNEVRLANNNYEELFDFTPACYYTLSSDGEILNLNKSGAKMLGKEPDKLIKSKFAFFLSDDTKPLFNNFLFNVFFSPHKQTCEVTLIREAELSIHVYIIGILSSGGEACHLNLIDITDKKKRENELNRTNKELEQSLNLIDDKNLFISILAHDLKSPFGALLGLTELLLMQISQNELSDIEIITKNINLSAKNIYDLLESMLKWSSIQLGKMPFEPKKLKFSDITTEVINILNNYAGSKNITVINSLKSDLHVYADRNMLNAILRNLLSNAIKFTDFNGKIELSATQLDSNLIVSVSDNGIGMAPEILSKLFDISHFHSTTGTADERGTGLGMLICKGFVEKHGGKIWAESEPGKGSTFYFNIPFKVEPKEKKSLSGEIDEKMNKELKILIVDDEYSLRLILGEMAKIFSSNILCANSGEAAVRLCRDNPDIDIIFMDYLMTGMNGVEAAREIREFNKEVIIILQTAFDVSYDSGEDHSVINDYFAKPYNKHSLLQLINKFFNIEIKAKPILQM